jgi:hypothetical protein
MSVLSSNHVNPLRWSRPLATWILMILVAAGLLLGSRDLLNNLQPPSGNEFQADWVPVVQNLVIPVPAPLAPAIAAGVHALSTPAPSPQAGESPAVIPVPVPTPPLW